MRPLLDRMRDAGASDTTVNAFIIMFMVFLFLVGLGALVIAGYDEIIKGVSPSPWVIGILTSLVGIISILFTVNHTTNALNTTQSRTVAEQHEITKPALDAASQSAIINAQTIQKTLSSMVQTNGTPATVPTQVIQENTQATKDNTGEMKREFQSG